MRDVFANSILNVNIFGSLLYRPPAFRHIQLFTSENSYENIFSIAGLRHLPLIVHRWNTWSSYFVEIPHRDRILWSFPSVE